MHVQVKHHLSAGSLTELLDDDPLRTKRGDRRDRDLLRCPRHLGEIIRRNIENTARGRFGYHQRMTW